MEVLLTARLLFSDAARVARPDRDYGRVRLREEWFAGSAAREVANALLLGGPFPQDRVPGFSVLHVNISESPQQFGEPWNSLTGWREDTFELRLQSVDSTISSGRPIARTGLPPHPSEAHAILDWVWPERLASFSGGTFPGSGDVMIVLPDTRARFSHVGWQNGVAYDVESNVASGATELQLWLRLRDGRTISGPGDSSKSLGVKDAEIAHGQLFLVHGATLLSTAKFSSPTKEPTERLDKLSPARATRAAIAAGESESIEFKPFLENGSKKAAEIVRTTIAFSNTGGGRLFIGVDDEAVPQGSEALRHAAKSSSSESQRPAKDALSARRSAISTLDDAKATMRARLVKIINDSVMPVPRVRTKWVELAGSPILVVEIPRSKNITSNHNRQIWIRRGSTNRVPEPDSELRALFSARPGTSDWMHGGFAHDSTIRKRR